MKIKTTLFSALFCVGFLTHAFAADSLYSTYSGKTVKVFIADTTDASETKEVSATALKGSLETALTERKSIHFKVVPSREEADIVIETTVKNFSWSDHDPIDMLIGVGAAAADAAMVEDYATLSADVIITETRSNRAVWKDNLVATITKKPMPRAESIPLIADGFAKLLVKEAFAKRRA